MFGGVLNSLTKKLGQTATRGEAGKLASLVGGEGAIAKATPKAVPKRSFKDELEKLRGEVFDAVDNGDYMYENPDLESLVSNLGKERGFSLSYDDGWDNYVVGMADRNMPIDVASKNMSELANEYGFKITTNPDGTYRLYHGTNKKAADSIRKGGFKDGRIYLSPSKEVEYGGVNGAGYYGDNILDVDVDPRNLMFNPSGEFYVDSSEFAKLAESVPEEALAYLGGGSNDLAKYIGDSSGFVAKKNLGAKTKTPAPRGRPTNEIRDSIAGTKIHPEDMDAMDEFIRYARNKKLRNSLPDDKQAKYELPMYDLAEHYGIKLNENATDPIRDMANRFIKAMDKQNLGGK